MGILGKVSRHLSYHFFFDRRLQKALADLETKSDKGSRLFKDVFKIYLEKNFSRKEKVRINEIENLRKKLEASSEELVLVNYESSSASHSSTEKQLYQNGGSITTIGDYCKLVSQPQKWASLLFRIIREFQPLSCLEMGTALGISTSYISAGLKLNNQGKIISLEGQSSLVSLARENLGILGFNNVNVRFGKFRNTLDEVLPELAPIDFAFIDGHHDKCATLTYFEEILPFTSSNSVLVFDDISWSEGMSEAWNTITQHKRIETYVNLKKLGLCSVAA
jgi:predicted O-methyltransferase YrrM